MGIFPNHVDLPQGTTPQLLGDVAAATEAKARYSTLTASVDYSIEVYLPPVGHPDNADVEGIWLGNETVAAANGRWLPAGGSWAADLPVNDELYAISPDGAVTVHVFRIMDFAS